MSQQWVTSDLFIVSLVVLLVVLLVLLVLCWTLRQNRIRNVTELQISVGRPARTLIIRTDPDGAQQLLERLLERVILPASGADPAEELQEVLEAAAPPSRVKTLKSKFWNLVTTAGSPQAPPPSDQDQSIELLPCEPSVSQHASMDSLDSQHASIDSQHAPLDSQHASLEFQNASLDSQNASCSTAATNK